MAVYDARNRLVRYWDARNIVVARTHDAIGRLLTESVGGVVQETYHYDLAPGQAGRLGRVDDIAGSVTFTYDIAGRVVAKSRAILGQTFSWATRTIRRASSRRLPTRTARVAIRAPRATAAPQAQRLRRPRSTTAPGGCAPAARQRRRRDASRSTPAGTSRTCHRARRAGPSRRHAHARRRRASHAIRRAVGPTRAARPTSTTRSAD